MGECGECGERTEYNLCDQCWIEAMMEAVEKHGPALAKREAG